MAISIKLEAKGSRQCGDCTLCCKLLPLSIKEREQEAAMAGEMISHGLLSLREAATAKPIFDKPAGKPCPHQRHGKGCTIYPQRPLSCRYWNCRWLVNDDTADLRRPDRSHYVIDIMPDFVTVRDDNSGERTNIQVVQIWVDPNYPDAHRDPALREYINRRGMEGVAAIIRLNARDAITVFPPSMNKQGEWREIQSGVRQVRSAAERWAGIASARKVIFG